MEDMLTIQNFGLLALGAILLFLLKNLKSLLDFSTNYISIYLDIKTQELEEMKRSNQHTEVQKAVEEGVNLAKQENKKAIKNDVQLSEDDLKTIAMEHVQSVVKSGDLPTSTISNKIEAEVAKTSIQPNTTTNIQIEPPADIKITEGQ